ncbi:MAG: hypothetical protein KDC90_01195, partial [Ignavibacteriae bacterium]|nr:hypothetical protein [Ignavibacteriota bacterium]
MELNWWNIRSFNYSQNNAFEELVCQLARNENILSKKAFYRVGTPDGGVEAYWQLESEEEYGWQAKYFHSMDKSQWDQLEKSFRTALKKHPKLLKYYICIPLDRSDPRIPNQNWFMDKWKLFVENSIKHAKSQNRKIEIEYWGSSELIDRLSSNENLGKLRFWFNKEEFSDEWFIEKCQNSIRSLENRYTPELNFELDIARNFSGIALDDKIKEIFRKAIHELLIGIDEIVHRLNNKSLNKECLELIGVSK